MRSPYPKMHTASGQTETTYDQGTSATSTVIEDTGNSHIPSHSNALGQLNDPTNDSNQGPASRVKSRKEEPRTGYLACLHVKYDEVHGLQTSCSYKGAKNMSRLKTHLTGRQHRQDFPFIDLCHTCWEYVIDGAKWRGFHVPKLCHQRTNMQSKQVRGPNRVYEQWQRLYTERFPLSERIPSPCKYLKTHMGHMLT
jgi:hypothetical protein